MNVEQLTSQASASNKIAVKDVTTIADTGAALLVFNRPDNEDESIYIVAQGHAVRDYTSKPMRSLVAKKNTIKYIHLHKLSIKNKAI